VFYVEMVELARIDLGLGLLRNMTLLKVGMKMCGGLKGMMLSVWACKGIAYRWLMVD
jgi:hypothetical protein